MRQARRRLPATSISIAIPSSILLRPLIGPSSNAVIDSLLGPLPESPRSPRERASSATARCENRFAVLVLHDVVVMRQLAWLQPSCRPHAPARKASGHAVAARPAVAGRPGRSICLGRSVSLVPGGTARQISEVVLGTFRDEPGERVAPQDLVLLVMTEGGQVIASHALPAAGAVVLGRDRSCAIVLDAARVSREH